MNHPMSESMENHAINQIAVSTEPTPVPMLQQTTDKAALASSYILAFIYTFALESSQIVIWQAVFTGLFCVGSMFVYRKQKTSVESWIWLGSLAIIQISILIGKNRVWGETAWLFLHAFSIYWLLNRSGRMAAGKSSRFFLLDVLYGVILIPFSNFFLRTRLLANRLSKTARVGKKIGNKVASLLAILAALLLLLAAVSLLSSADPVFGRLLGDFLRRFNWQILSEFFFRFVLSLPVGAFLFGLVIGAKRLDPRRMAMQGESINRQLENIRQVPATVWNALLLVFVLVYLLFFVVQASYLFGAFTQTLPHDFTIANYARQGFFELCMIMALNFSLLWIVIRSSKAGMDLRHHRFSLFTGTLILIESILFAATAFSKLYFYIDTYGFTPLRWQSTWLVVVLLAGCIAALVSIWSGRQTSRYWLMFSGVSLALMHLY